MTTQYPRRAAQTARHAFDWFAFCFYGAVIFALLLAAVMLHARVSVAHAEVMPPLYLETYIVYVSK